MNIKLQDIKLSSSKERVHLYLGIRVKAMTTDDYNKEKTGITTL